MDYDNQEGGLRGMTSNGDCDAGTLDNNIF